MLPVMPALHKAQIIDGKAIALRVKDAVRLRAQRLASQDRPVRLDSLLVGADASARIYAQNQAHTCRELGIEYRLHELPATARYEDVAGRVLLLNADDNVHALMVHLPLPAGIATEKIHALIDPHKDVEGVNPANIGNVVYGRRSLVPCTALAIMEMIESTGIELAGTRCVCVGASNIVGKPVVVLLMQAQATVISTNVHTERQEELTRTADVLVAAAGVRGLIGADMVKPGAVVIDVGIHRIQAADGKTRTVGDVRFDEVAGVAGWVSPVPGGVGPVTVAMLLRNVVDSAEMG